MAVNFWLTSGLDSCKLALKTDCHEACLKATNNWNMLQKLCESKTYYDNKPSRSCRLPVKARDNLLLKKSPKIENFDSMCLIGFVI